MFFSLFYAKKRPLIVLDINHEEIRILQLKRVKEELWVEQVYIGALDAGAIVDGRIQSLQTVRAAIEKAVQATHTKGAEVAIALPMQSVITKRIKLNEELSPEECEAEINANMADYFPHATEDLVFDFVLENPSDVLLIAARKSQLNEYLTVVKQAGLKIKIVDVDSYALSRGAGFMSAEQKLAEHLDGNALLQIAPRLLVGYGLALRSCAA